MRVDLCRKGRGAPKTGRERETPRCGKKTESKHPAPLQDKNGGREGHEKNRADGVCPPAERGMLMVDRAGVLVDRRLAAKGANGGHQDEGEISRQKQSGDQKSKRAWEHGDIIIFEWNIVKTF
jgi:hypothetical protein